MPVFTIETPTGQKLDIEAADQATALQGAQQWHKQNAPSTGIAAGLQQGVSDLVRGDSQTSQQVLGTSGSAQSAADAIAPKNYQSPDVIPKDGHWYDPTTYNWGAIPQKLAEAAPGVAQDLAIGRTAGAVAGPGVGLAAGLGSYAWRTFGPEAKAAAYARTGDANATPNKEDNLKALEKTAATTAIQGVGMRRFLPIGSPINKGVVSTAKNLGTTAATEAGTGAASSAAGQLIDNGTIDPNKVAEGAIVQGAGGLALGAPHAAGGMADAFRFRNFDPESATRVANRLTQNAGGGDLADPRVGDASRAKTGADINRELGDATKSLTTQLAPDHANILENAQKGMVPTGSQEAALRSALASDPNGQSVMDLLKDKQTHSAFEDTGVSSNGQMLGGLARKIPGLLGLNGHGVAKSLLAAAAIEHFGSHLIAMSPAAIGLGGAAYGGARLIDNITGARSPAQRFANRFGDDTGIGRTPIVAPQQPQAPAPLVAPNASPIAPPQGGPGNPWGPAPRPSGQVPVMPPAPAAPPVAASGNPYAAQIQGAQAMMAARNANAKLASQQAGPLLKQLAQQGKPVDLPDNFASSMISNPGAPQAAPVAPPAAPAINPLTLPKSITAPAKSIMDGQAWLQKLKQNTLGQEQANEAVKKSPFIDQTVGGAQNVPDPATAKAMKQAIGSANALAKLQSDPAAAAEEAAAQKADAAQLKEAAAQAKAQAKANATAQAVAAKISKAKDGPVKATPGAQPQVAPQPALQAATQAAAPEHIPLTPEQMPYKGMSAKSIRDAEVQKYEPHLRKVYGDKIEASQKLRATTLTDLAMAHPADEAPLGGLLDELKHYTRSQTAAVQSSINHWTSQMTPEGAKATRAKLNNEFIGKVWGSGKK